MELTGMRDQEGKFPDHNPTRTIVRFVVRPPFVYTLRAILWSDCGTQQTADVLLCDAQKCRYLDLLFACIP
jgi:hypothetical protein